MLSACGTNAVLRTLRVEFGSGCNAYQILPIVIGFLCKFLRLSCVEFVVDSTPLLRLLPLRLFLLFCGFSGDFAGNCIRKSSEFLDDRLEKHRLYAAADEGSGAGPVCSGPHQGQRLLSASFEEIIFVFDI